MVGCQSDSIPTFSNKGKYILNLTLLTDKDTYVSGESIVATLVLSNDLGETVLVKK